MGILNAFQDANNAAILLPVPLDRDVAVGGTISTGPRLEDDPLHHDLIFLGAAAVPGGDDDPLLNELQQELVDEPQPCLNG